jgi:translation initiation factor IF-1
MSKEEVLGGTIEEALPSALYRVKLDDGTTIVAGLSTEARRTLIKIGPGDRVSLSRSPFDPSRGKITGKRTTPSRQGGAT